MAAELEICFRNGEAIYFSMMLIASLKEDDCLFVNSSSAGSSLAARWEKTD